MVGILIELDGLLDALRVLRDDVDGLELLEGADDFSESVFELFERAVEFLDVGKDLRLEGVLEGG